MKEVGHIDALKRCHAVPAILCTECGVVWSLLVLRRLAASAHGGVNGGRSAGVLTKIDIMDKGTNALSMLRNEVLPLRLGYTAVVNRSQQDIQERTSVTKARENEAEFFRGQAMYMAVEGQCGVPALSKRCGPPGLVLSGATVQVCGGLLDKERLCRCKHRWVQRSSP